MSIFLHYGQSYGNGLYLIRPQGTCTLLTKDNELEFQWRLHSYIYCFRVHVGWLLFQLLSVVTQNKDFLLTRLPYCIYICHMAYIYSTIAEKYRKEFPSVILIRPGGKASVTTNNSSPIHDQNSSNMFFLVPKPFCYFPQIGNKQPHN